MRKSNVILAVVAAVASAFLLWLWFYLGFNTADSPLDLVLSVVWWVVILAGAAFVAKAEATRRQSVRTAYVGAGKLYNSESGVREVAAGASAAAVLAGVLEHLDYGFDRVAGPDPRDRQNPVEWSHVVHTNKYEAPGASAEVWEGEVVVVATGNTVPFSSRAELARIIG